MNWPCRKRAYKTVFIKNGFVERWHFLGRFICKTQAMIDAFWSGVLFYLNVWNFALLEDLVYCHRPFVYQNQYLLYLDYASYCPCLQARMVTISEQNLLDTFDN
jgi:hypothetical protein